MAGEEETVADIMEKKVHSVALDTNVRDCSKGMAKRGVSCSVVTRDGLAVGLLTERDLVVKVIADGLEPSKVLVGDIMSTPLITIKPNAGVTEAAELMSSYAIRRLVVVDDSGSLVGIVTAGDLAKMMAQKRGFADVKLNALARVSDGPMGGPYQ